MIALKGFALILLTMAIIGNVKSIPKIYADVDHGPGAYCDRNPENNCDPSLTCYRNQCVGCSSGLCYEFELQPKARQWFPYNHNSMSNGIDKLALIKRILESRPITAESKALLGV